MEIYIDDVNFWDLDAQNYWSFPASYDLARKKKEAKEMVYSEHYLGARKMDGIWLMIIRDVDGTFHARTRTKNVNGTFEDKADWIPHIIKELEYVPNGSVILGELYFPNNEGSRKVTSVFNCLKDKCLERQEKNGYLHFYAFDVLAWNNVCIMNKIFKNRIELHLEAIDVTEHIERAEYKVGKELWELYQTVLAEGGEGIVIQKDMSQYLPGKRKARESLKMKVELKELIDAFLDGNFKPATRLYTGKELASWTFFENTKTGEKVNKNIGIELIESGAFEPVTKPYFYGWAGSVSFSTMKDGKPVHIGWISNIPDELKKGIIENPEKWVNKVAALNAMQIECINGNYSFRHGKIDTWRDDKRPEDCSYDQLTK